ncbi:type II toxin-antitoxin system antitoxin SocA domain-containing protein [Acidomonas methanolica]|uniref:type II toxin-antitoxin system antitoxin SocA domain-containing protein n=1 Tax=Acidomonas methanolica TaxID=437 RepID=UPI002119F147|nr:Panacea domain-containing protein [Acidomonas methanolica]MCQ9157245.1 SocA family protein [Acidomonas methanolica]
MSETVARREARITFRFAPEKAASALHWMLAEAQKRNRSVDLHTALKACYFADRKLLNSVGQPVFGARYRAMKFGPVPLEIYEMAKCEPMWLAELGLSSFPWRLDGYALKMVSNEAPNMTTLSDADMRALEEGFDRSIDMTFTARTAATHGKDWQAANLGMMAYEDMLDDAADKEEKVNYLREAAPYMRL